MTWILSSFIMFVSSVALYLAVRKSSLLKVPTQLNNLAMFAVPLLLYTFIGVSTHQNYVTGFTQAVIIAVAALFFSYLGSVLSLKSIEYAPNPGYSLVLSKSYVVFTTLISVLFLSGDLTLRNALAIIVIVVFSAVISIDPKASKQTFKRSWMPLAIGAFFCWGFLSLTSKYLFSQGMNTYVFLTYVSAIVTLCVLGEIHHKRIDYGYLKRNPLILLLIGLFSASFNLFMFQAIRLAPNVGYVNAINASSISLVTICSILLFKDEFSVKKLIGVLGVSSGLLLLLL